MDALIFYFYLIVKCTVKKCCVNEEILFLFVFLMFPISCLFFAIYMYHRYLIRKS